MGEFGAAVALGAEPRRRYPNATPTSRQMTETTYDWVLVQCHEVELFVSAIAILLSKSPDLYTNCPVTIGRWGVIEITGARERDPRGSFFAGRQGNLTCEEFRLATAMFPSGLYAPSPCAISASQPEPNQHELRESLVNA